MVMCIGKLSKIFSTLDTKDVIYLVGLLTIFILVTILPEIKYIKVFLIFSVPFIYYFMIHRKWGDYGKFSKIISVFTLVSISLGAVGYMAISVSQITLALGAIISTFLLLFLLPVVLYIIILHSSKNIPTIILSYLVLSALTILMFAFIFSLSVNFSGNEILWSNSNTKVDSIGNQIYFSSLVFYSNVFGDIVPYGISKIIVVSELAWSFVLHLIILGEVISNYHKRNEIPHKKKLNRRK